MKQGRPSLPQAPPSHPSSLLSCHTPSFLAPRVPPKGLKTLKGGHRWADAGGQSEHGEEQVVLVRSAPKSWAAVDRDPAGTRKPAVRGKLRSCAWLRVAGARRFATGKRARGADLGVAPWSPPSPPKSCCCLPSDGEVRQDLLAGLWQSEGTGPILLPRLAFGGRCQCRRRFGRISLG